MKTQTVQSVIQFVTECQSRRDKLESFKGTTSAPCHHSTDDTGFDPLSWQLESSKAADRALMKRPDPIENTGSDSLSWKLESSKAASPTAVTTSSATFEPQQGD